MTGWIPVADITHRPKEDEIVFIYDGKEVSVGDYHSDEWVNLSRDLSRDVGGVITHWMPIELPDPPGCKEGCELNAREAYDSGFAFADRVIGIDIHKVACNMLGDNATPENIEAWIAGFNAARRAPE